eukprot:TRINITY_DN5615_c0_g1_i3.p1 TRINITY_DN5615_c0_g1~~TRINITY_DN5615_c0_g1_i3.p1  ORF type:complete len:290 (-),score=45.58 TRINITY_DN5615_c0_g1_i3:179-1048(-)
MSEMSTSDDSMEDGEIVEIGQDEDLITQQSTTARDSSSASYRSPVARRDFETERAEREWLEKVEKRDEKLGESLDKWASTRVPVQMLRQPTSSHDRFIFALVLNIEKSDTVLQVSIYHKASLNSKTIRVCPPEHYDTWSQLLPFIPFTSSLGGDGDIPLEAHSCGQILQDFVLEYIPPKSHDSPIILGHRFLDVNPTSNHRLDFLKLLGFTNILIPRELYSYPRFQKVSLVESIRGILEAEFAPNSSPLAHLNSFLKEKRFSSSFEIHVSFRLVVVAPYNLVLTIVSKN